MAGAGALTAGQIRGLIANEKLGWRAAEQLQTDELVPLHALGGKPDRLPASAETGPVDFATRFDQAPINPYLAERALARGLLSTAVARAAAEPVPLAAQLNVGHFGVGGGAAPAAAASVDWRSRWGWPWITSVRDQGGCEACWAFAAVALVEAMARVEHCYWPHYSEGDVHRGIGAKCADTGNVEAAVNWIREHGLCDPECFPWTEADIPYAPSPDRDGRTVRGNMQATWVGSVADQKTWLDTVGPLATFFEVWADFDGYSSGVYHRSMSQQNYDRGGHFMLVVGYDDTQNAWIVKNSWGTGWGMSGYALIGYGEASIDAYSKLGLQQLNPDPWTKRRVHNGNMIESGNGSQYRNFEMLATVAGGGQLQHWWRDNSTSGFPWHTAYPPFAGDAAVCPTLTSTTYNRNFECVYMTIGGRLHHWYLDQNTHQWNDGGVFGPQDVAGVPGFIQGNYGKPGNFEVVVRTRDGRLAHWWRQDGAPWTWSESTRFASNVAFSGASLIQSNYGTQGNLELVCVLESGQMQHCWRDDDHGMAWHAGTTFGSGCSSGPCMIEGQFGASSENDIGNFELCVAAGGRAQHWWRDNHGDGQWRQSATFGDSVQAVVALIEGSFGFNLEVILLRADRKLQHWWRDGAGWHEGVVIGSA
jgi:C1A family cysteine protease